MGGPLLLNPGCFITRPIPEGNNRTSAAKAAWDSDLMAQVTVVPFQDPVLMQRLRGSYLRHTAWSFVDVVNHDGVAFELNLVVIASRAFHVTATVRIRVVGQLYSIGRAF